MSDQHKQGGWPSALWRTVVVCGICALLCGCQHERSTSSWPLDDGDRSHRKFPILDGWPTWSPDGNRIAYWSEEAKDGELAIRTCISVLDIQTGHTDTLLDTDGFAVFSTDWSPGGEHLLLSTPDGIQTLSLSDSTLRMINPGEFLTSASWSSASDRIFYCTYVGNFGMYSVNPDGSDVRRISDDVLEPWVAPDCDSLVAYRSGCLGTFVPDRLESFQPVRCSLDIETHSVLTPDHRAVAFLGRASANGGSRNLSLLDRATGKIDTLVSSGVYWFDFSPDGQSIVFVEPSHFPGLQMINLATKEVRALTRTE